MIDFWFTCRKRTGNLIVKNRMCMVETALSKSPHVQYKSNSSSIDDHSIES